jgi:hypothetical protein
MAITSFRTWAVPILTGFLLAGCGARVPASTGSAGAVGESGPTAATGQAPAAAASRTPEEQAADRALEQRFGVKAVSIHPVAGGNLVYFRYKVLDADRAAPVLGLKGAPVLKDHATGVALQVPSDTKIGALRSSPKTPPMNGKEYFVLFSNPQLAVKPGSAVDVAMGDCVFQGLVVD